MAVLLVACESQPAPVSTGVPSETPVRGGRLVLGTGEITTLQPILSGDDGAGSGTRYMYWPMLEREPATGELVPGLAKSFELSADGKRLTFHLRDGLVWSDGEPITGEDYRYYVEASARSKKTPWKSKFQDIVGWSDYSQGRDRSLRGIRIANSGRDVEVALERNSCRTLENLNLAPIPQHLFVKQWDNATNDVSTSIDNAPFNTAPPAASGPFLFKEFAPGVQVVATRNDHYFKGAPLIEQIVLKVYGSAAAQRNAFVTGETSSFNAKPADVDFVRQQAPPSVREYRIQDALGYSFIAWNQKAAGAPWLADKRVRQALWYGLDVKTILDKVDLGYGHQVYANTPTASWAYDPSGLNHYDYDPKRARGLIESAGAVMGDDGIYRWSGQQMEVRIETNSGNASRASIVQIAQEQYKQIGIKVTPVIEAFSLLTKRLLPSDDTLEGVLIGWTFLQPDPEPDAFQIWHSSQQKDGYNFIGIANTQLDAALDAGRLGPDCSLAARKKAYHAADLILNDEAAYTFLYQTDSAFFVQPSLVAGTPKPWGSWSGVEKWWIRP
jgi:peptide/nickel transport system substrate-binding protein